MTKTLQEMIKPILTQTNIVKGRIGIYQNPK